MFKWRKMIKFIKKHRKIGIASFRVVTNSNTFVMWVTDPEKGIDEQIRIPYK